MSDFVPVFPNAVLEEDTTRFNLLAPNLLREYNLCVNRLRYGLSRGGKIIEGNLRTTCDNRDHPLVRLELVVRDQTLIASTEIMAEKINGYSFLFYADNQWRRTKFGGTYTFVPDPNNPNQCAVICSAKFEYRNHRTKGGPGAIFKAIDGLRSRNSAKWQGHFHTICQLFIEPARLVYCQQMMARTLVPAQEMIDGTLVSVLDVYHSTKTLPDLYFEYIHSWGDLSKELRKGRAVFDAELNEARAQEVAEGRDPDEGYPAVMKKFGFTSFDHILLAVGVALR